MTIYLGFGIHVGFIPGAPYTFIAAGWSFFALCHSVLKYTAISMGHKNKGFASAIEPM